MGKAHISILEGHPLPKLSVVKTVSVQILFGQIVQITAKVEINLIGLRAVNLALQGLVISTEYSNVLGLGMIHCPRDRIVFGFHSHHKLCASVAVHSKHIKEII